MKLLTLIFDLGAMLMQCVFVLNMKAALTGEDSTGVYSAIVFLFLNVVLMQLGYWTNCRIKPEKEDRFINVQKAPVFACGVCLLSTPYFLISSKFDKNCKREVGFTAAIILIYFIISAAVL